MKKLSMDVFFSKDGPLSKVISGYQIRPSQVAMSNLVDETIFNQNSLVVEAGTGIGKTFAYLAPALMRGETVIISTATKNLQDQLYNKDIPKIREALNIPIKVDLLKGRSNYVCQLKMEDSLISGQFLNKEDGVYLEKIKIFAYIAS